MGIISMTLESFSRSNRRETAQFWSLLDVVNDCIIKLLSLFYSILLPNDYPYIWTVEIILSCETVPSDLVILINDTKVAAIKKKNSFDIINVLLSTVLYRLSGAQITGTSLIRIATMLICFTYLAICSSASAPILGNHIAIIHCKLLR